MPRRIITSVVALGGRLKSKKGQSLAEYALMLSFVSLSSIAVMSVLGVQAKAVYVPIAHALQAAYAIIQPAILH